MPHFVVQQMLKDERRRKAHKVQKRNKSKCFRRHTNHLWLLFRSSQFNKLQHMDIAEKERTEKFKFLISIFIKF